MEGKARESGIKEGRKEGRKEEATVLRKRGKGEGGRISGENVRESERK